jgi:hypothetical protein
MRAGRAPSPPAGRPCSARAEYGELARALAARPSHGGVDDVGSRKREPCCHRQPRYRWRKRPCNQGR